MRVVLIDNYDSFTWNLVQALTGSRPPASSGTHAPRPPAAEVGRVEVEVLRNDAVSVGEVLARSPAAIVVSPGPSGPDEAGISVPLVRRASGRIPLLGVCLGHQSLGVAFGARVVRAETLMHGKTSIIRHDDTGVFAGLPEAPEATRYHSLVLEATSLPACLRVTARSEAPDAGTIMGVAHRTHPTWGVQFHPESILTATGSALLANFLELARRHPAEQTSGAEALGASEPASPSEPQPC